MQPVVYVSIGQQVRRLRKARGFSQEQLAEMINISTTHMSHIETGSAKLSLPVFLDLAEALGVPADSLLHDEDTLPDSVLTRNALTVMKQCTTSQLRVITDLIITAKKAMDAYF